MYERQYGDDLCSNDKRLKLKWRWSRSATRVEAEELKKWTHFQCSEATLGEWTLESVQWGDEESVDYEAQIFYNSDIIASSEHYKTRLDAQIAAEKLLIEWIKKQKEIIDQTFQESEVKDGKAR